MVGVRNKVKEKDDKNNRQKVTKVRTVKVKQRNENTKKGKKLRG